MTFAPSNLPASSNEALVLVDGSKNKLKILLFLRIGEMLFLFFNDFSYLFAN